jgi:hypothetical protein
MSIGPSHPSLTLSTRPLTADPTGPAVPSSAPVSRDVDLIPSHDGIVKVVGLPAALSVSEGAKTVYRFRRDDTVTEVELDDHQTVADAKEIYGTKTATDPQLISFLCRGRRLNDHFILSRQRIPPGQEIVVFVRDLREVIIYSSPGVLEPAPELPDDYDQQLDRLVAQSGRDRDICGSCFIYHHCDFAAALGDLMS